MSTNNNNKSSASSFKENSNEQQKMNTNTNLIPNQAITMTNTSSIQQQQQIIIQNRSISNPTFVQQQPQQRQMQNQSNVATISSNQSTNTTAALSNKMNNQLQSSTSNFAQKQQTSNNNNNSLNANGKRASEPINPIMGGPQFKKSKSDEGPSLSNNTNTNTNTNMNTNINNMNSTNTNMSSNLQNHNMQTNPQLRNTAQNNSSNIITKTPSMTFNSPISNNNNTNNNIQTKSNSGSLNPQVQQPQIQQQTNTNQFQQQKLQQQQTQLNVDVLLNSDPLSFDAELLAQMQNVNNLFNSLMQEKQNHIDSLTETLQTQQEQRQKEQLSFQTLQSELQSTKNLLYQAFALSFQSQSLNWNVSELQTQLQNCLSSHIPLEVKEKIEKTYPQQQQQQPQVVQLPVQVQSPPQQQTFVNNNNNQNNNNNNNNNNSSVIQQQFPQQHQQVQIPPQVQSPPQQQTFVSTSVQNQQNQMLNNNNAMNRMNSWPPPNQQHQNNFNNTNQNLPQTNTLNANNANNNQSKAPVFANSKFVAQPATRTFIPNPIPPQGVNQQPMNQMQTQNQLSGQATSTTTTTTATTTSNSNQQGRHRSESNSNPTTTTAAVQQTNINTNQTNINTMNNTNTTTTVQQQKISGKMARPNLGAAESAFKDFPQLLERTQTLSNGIYLDILKKDDSVFTTFTDEIWVKQNEFAFSLITEKTTNMNNHSSYFPNSERIVAVIVSWQQNRAIYIQLKPALVQTTVDRFEMLKHKMQAKTIRKLCWDIKKELKVLTDYGINLFDVPLYDPFLMSVMISTSPIAFSKTASKKEIHKPTLEFAVKEYLKIDCVTPTDATEYGAMKVTYSFQLFRALEAKYVPMEIRQLIDFEMRIIPIISEMETNGMCFDAERLKSYKVLFERRLQEIETESKKYMPVSNPFPLGDSQRLSKLLFSTKEEGGLAIPIPDGAQNMKQGTPSTNQELLELISDKHPLPMLVLEHRKISRNLAMYLSGEKDKSALLSYVVRLNEQTQPKIYTNIEQIGTATGRFSYSSPNLSNITHDVHFALSTNMVELIQQTGMNSIQTNTEKTMGTFSVRNAFVASSGYSLLSADYGQIEVRILAHLSQDQKLATMLQKDVDIFRQMATEIFHRSTDQISEDERNLTKTIFYAILYGLGNNALMHKLQMPRQRAEEILRSFKTKFTGVDAFMHSTKKEAISKGFVETMKHRKRWFKNQVQTSAEKSELEREAFSTVVQGSAADLMKEVMYNVCAQLKRENKKARLLLQLHDELIFEVANEEIKSISEIVRKEMTTPQLLVPLVVKIKVGQNWAGLSDLK